MTIWEKTQRFVVGFLLLSIILGSILGALAGLLWLGVTYLTPMSGIILCAVAGVAVLTAIMMRDTNWLEH